MAATLAGGAWTDYIYGYPVGAGNRSPQSPAAGSVRLAAAIGSGVGDLQFFHADQIGTTRAITDQNASNLASCGQNPTYPNGSFLTYSPFGLAMGCTQTATEFLFTGRVLGAGSNLDDFQYRKYATLEARWLAPDPAGVNSTAPPAPGDFGLSALAATPPACATCGTPDDQLALPHDLPGFGLPLGGVDPDNPQTRNPYAYVGNSPGSFADADGRSWKWWNRFWKVATAVYTAFIGVCQWFNHCQ